MRKRIYNSLLIGLIAIVLQACAETKQSLYHFFIELERDRGDLVADRLAVAGIEFSYLRSKRFRPPGQDMDQSDAVPERNEEDDEAEPAAADAIPREVLVLLHGFGGDKDNWVKLAAQLGQRYTLIIPDLPGHGESTRDLALSYDLPQQVARLRNFFRTLGLGRVHIAGNSMGGAIAAMYAAKYPRQIQTVTLFDPAGIYDVESEFTKAVVAGTNSLIVRKPEDFDKLISLVMEDPPFMPWPILSVIAEHAVEQAPVLDKIFEDLNPQEPAYDFKSLIKEIKAPTLVLWGAKDRVIAPGNAELFTQLIPNARKYIFDDVGHLPMLERPEKSAELMQSFISNQLKYISAQ